MFYKEQVPGHYPKDTLVASLSKTTATRNVNKNTKTNQRSSRSSSGPKTSGRRIGRQECPLDPTYYDTLGISHCQSISIAFQTLSVPALRPKYNEFGTRESTTESVFVDPEEVFGKIFGGERFVGVIGHISLARDMKAALQEAKEMEEGEGKAIRDGNSVDSEEVRTRKKAAERALAGTERFTQFSTNLDATGINDVDVMTSWRTICELEAE
ncbi:hypothetical protein F5051DRAFT_462338 [Lentinula edodes]|nr:hypothetical protein F5051DRAFT_462338 [Lentinula edodes]